MNSGSRHIGRSGSVLIDVSHGVFPLWHNHPDSAFTQLQDLLNEMRYPSIVSDSGVQHLDLSRFNGMILTAIWAEFFPYTEEEAFIIRDYVEKSGGLLIISDNPIVAPPINPIAQIFGTTTGANTLPGPLFITNLSDHPIFMEVNVIYFYGGGELLASFPSEEVAWDALDRGVVAVAEVGAGRVVIVGSSQIFDDFASPSFWENETFIRNIFLWILRIGCFSFDDLEGTLAKAEIDNQGVLRSLQSKAENAQSQFDLGNIQTSGNILCALLHEVDAQEGKHIEPFSAQEIGDCVQSMAEVLEIPLPCLGRNEAVALLLEISPNPLSFRGGELKVTGYSLPTPSNTTLKIYDVTGRLVRTLIEGNPGFETFSIPWDGRNNGGREVRTGVYYLRLNSGKSSLTRKLVLLK